VRAFVLELHGDPDSHRVLEAASRDSDRHGIVGEDVGVKSYPSTLDERTTIAEGTHESQHFVEVRVGSECDVVVRLWSVAGVQNA
jgi:hypothetical protein